MRNLMRSAAGLALMVSLTLFAMSRGTLAQRAEIEGELEIVVEDHPSGGVIRHFIHANGRRELRGAELSQLRTGDRIRVRGSEQPDGSIALDGDTSPELVSAAQTATLGTQTTLLLLINFENNPVEPYTLQQAQSVMGQVANHFWRDSYEQTTLVSDVAGWFTVKYPTAICDSTRIAAQADQAAVDAGVNLDAYAHRVYAFPQIPACGWWGLGTVGGNPSKSWVNGALALKVVGHELGHALGLYHAKALECGTVTLGPSCSTIEYGNPVDIMGNPQTGDFNLVGKERIGWINAGVSPPLSVATSSGTYWIGAYEALDRNTKGLKVLKSIDGAGAKTYYYLEFRQPIGNDEFLTAYDNVRSGVLISMKSESNLDGNLLLDMTPDTSAWWDAALVAGRTFIDPTSGISIRTLVTNNAGAIVDITLPPPAAPTATMRLNTSTPDSNDVLTASATVADPNGDSVTLTYSWRVNGVLKRTSASTRLTDTFDLRVSGQGDPGDIVTVDVTPSDGTLSGPTVSATATVQKNGKKR